MSGSDIIGPLGADTRLDTLAAADPAATARLAQLHPAFHPETGRGMGVPAEASLGDMARAIGIPLDAVLSVARGEIRVQVQDGGGCGCSCGGGGKH
ncbi:MAG TPA: hypothetical protein VGE72_19810 [Azospirillum sp.]